VSSRTGERKVVELAGSDLVARVDELGCRIASLRHRASGGEVLFVAPWTSRPLPPRPASNAEWVAHWRGGWDVLVPNAGAPSGGGDDARGFHGEASVERWSLQVEAPERLTGRWTDRTGLTVERSIAVDGPRLHVASTATNPTTEPVPFVWVEHLILDGAWVGPRARLDVTGRAVAFGGSRQPTDA